MNLKTIKLGRHQIGTGHDPYIIVEMSGNHNGSLDRALTIVEEAAKTGAQALKLQTYTADTMTIDSKKDGFVIEDPKSPWYGRNLYELYQEAHTPWEWHKPIFDKANELGMDCFSTPFDSTAVDFLEDLGCPFYKIASFENTDHELIKKVASTGKPVIMSSGASYLEELVESVNLLKEHGCEDLILLKCTSNYPSDPADSNIATIPHMRELFKCQIGLSDHTLGIGVPIASVALGATVIEKHFTLSRDEGGVDSMFSLEPHEMKSLVAESKIAARALGEVSYTPTQKEMNSRTYKRSIYIVKDVKKGERISEEHIRAIRPSLGLPVKFYGQVLGMKANRDLLAGEPTSFEIFSGE